MTLQYASETFVSVQDVRDDTECGCVTEDNPGDSTIEGWIEAASDLIAITTSMRVAGRQQVVARPCRKYGAGACDPCCDTKGIPLGDEPVEINSVKIDGETLPSSEYRLEWNGIMWVLVRQPAAGEQRPRDWPTWQKMWLADTETDTFSITFTQGVNPDQHLIKTATLEVVCDFASESRVRETALHGVTDVVVGGATVHLDPDRMERLRQGAMGPMSERLLAVMAPQGRAQSQVWAPEITGGWDLNLRLPAA